MAIFLQLRSGNSGPVFQGENEGDTLLWSVAQQRFYVGPAGGGAGVTSWNGRTGAVEPEDDDYNSDQIENVSTVAGASVSDALETLAAQAGGGVNLSTTRWVDAQTTVAEEDQTGAIGAPFSTVTAALASLQDAFDTFGEQVAYVARVCPGNYSEEDPLTWSGDAALVVRGEAEEGVMFSGLNQVILPGITVGGSIWGLTMANVSTGDIETAADLNVFNCLCNGKVEAAGNLDLWGSIVFGAITFRDNARMGELRLVGAQPITQSDGTGFGDCTVKLWEVETADGNTFVGGAMGVLQVDATTNYWIQRQENTITGFDRGYVVTALDGETDYVMHATAVDLPFATEASPNVYVPIAATAGNFAIDPTPPGGSPFALGANGVLTYNGPSGRTALITSTGTLEIDDAGYVSLGMALNGDLIGAEQLDAEAVAAGTNVALIRGGFGLANVTAIRRVVLANGDTLQPVAAVDVFEGSTPGNALLEGFSCSIEVR